MAEHRFMDEVRAVLRRLHYSIHTERTYCDWIARYIRFHQFESRGDVLGAQALDLERFLTQQA